MSLRPCESPEVISEDLGESQYSQFECLSHPIFNLPQYSNLSCDNSNFSTRESLFQVMHSNLVLRITYESDLDWWRLNVHGTRIATKTQSVATGTAHKLNLNGRRRIRSTRVAPRVAHNAINDTANLKLVWKERLNPGESLFSSNCHTTMHHTPLLRANRPPIAVWFLQFRAPIVNFGFLWRAHAVIGRDCVHVRLTWMIFSNLSFSNLWSNFVTNVARKSKNFILYLAGFLKLAPILRRSWFMSGSQWESESIDSFFTSPCLCVSFGVHPQRSGWLHSFEESQVTPQSEQNGGNRSH
jgi:hypothetical protein